VIEILKRRGMEFQQQRPGTARVKTARLGTSSSQERPMTVQASYSANRAFAAPPDPIKPSPIRMPVLEAGGLSSQQSQHFGNTEGSFAFQRPQKQSLLQFPAQSTPLQKQPAHFVTTHERENAMAAPDLSRSHKAKAPFQRPMDDAATGLSDMSNHMHMATTSNHGQDEPAVEHLSKTPALLSERSTAQAEIRDIASSSTENRTLPTFATPFDEDARDIGARDAASARIAVQKTGEPSKLELEPKHNIEISLLQCHWRQL
jgi:hypothetical protein